jgi:hypothetical protein
VKLLLGCVTPAVKACTLCDAYLTSAMTMHSFQDLVVKSTDEAGLLDGVTAAVRSRLKWLTNRGSASDEESRRLDLHRRMANVSLSLPYAVVTNISILTLVALGPKLCPVARRCERPRPPGRPRGVEAHRRERRIL